MSEVAGMLIIDKPGGITSHDVINRIRRVTGRRRVGHAGTLDPLATGMLLVCVGRATRLVEYLVGHTKSYQATVQLGVETNTYDMEGEIIAERPYDHVSRQSLIDALAQFRGVIQQKPPLYSAIKKNGRPLYKLAREGKTTDLPLREVTVHQLDLKAWSPPAVHLHINCSSGTYIRSLAHDLGQALLCGGHITALRRTAIGQFTIDQATPLSALTAEDWRHKLLPMDTAVGHLPRLDLDGSDTNHVINGRPAIRRPGHLDAVQTRAYDPAGQFIGILRAEDQVWLPQKILYPMRSS